MKKRDPKKFLESIKEKVDFIYELTKDGYNDNFSQFNDRLLDECLAEVVRSGALIKTPYYRGGQGRKYTFKWNPNAPEPTLVFYKNIAKAVADVHDAKADRWRKAKRAQREREKLATLIENTQKEELDTQSTPTPVVKEEKKPEAEIRYVYIKDYSDIQLWEELKDRGYQIEDNRLVKKQYLD